MANVEVAYITARTLLNDDGNSLYTDAVLAPKMFEAHMELQAKLRRADCQVMKKFAPSNVVANSTTLAAPTDLLEPIKLWEKVQGSSDTTYVEMTEQDPLPPAQAPGTTALGVWQWDGTQFNFVGATGNVTVKIHYWRTITIPVNSGDPIGIIFGELYLAPRVAALMAGSLGEKERLLYLSDVANKNLDDVISANKGRMNILVRP